MMLRLTLLPTIILVLTGLTGCDSRHASVKQDGIIYCSEGSPSSFNPQLDTSGTTADASAHQIYDRLIDFDPVSGKIIPALASSWLVSRDGLTYTFQLRRKVSFHSTSYFTPSRFFNADDVLFTINRWRDPTHPYHSVSGGQYPYFSALGLRQVIKAIKRVNGYRVEITLNEPNSSFLSNLATDYAVILSAEYAKQLTENNTPAQIDQLPIGTGPFQFNEYRKDRFIRYAKHDQYWKHDQAVSQLIFDITSSSSLRLTKLLTTECDSIAFPSQTELSAVRQREDLALDVKAGLNVGYWAFNTAKPPFDNPLVRRALAMAIDKNALLETIYSDSATRAKSIIPPTSWAYQPDLKDIVYNPVAARKLLQQNGLQDGFSMTIWAMPVERAYNPNAVKMAEIMQQELAQVGVTANIVSYDWENFLERVSQGQHDTVLLGWSADTGDPDSLYRPLLTCAALESGTNRTGWCNKDYDNYVNQALTLSDEIDRADYYHLANQLIAEQVPLLPIAHAYRYQAYRNDLRGLAINPYGGIRFGDVTRSIP